MRAYPLGLLIGAPSFLEESCEEHRRFVGADTGHHLDLVVEARIHGEVVERAARAGVRICGAEHDLIDAGRHQRAGAHRAGLQRDNQGGALEAPGSHHLGGVSEREQLGMGSRIAGPLALVVALGDHLTVAEHDSAHRHVVVGDGQSGLVERKLHRGIEIHGVRRYRLRRAALTDEIERSRHLAGRRVLSDRLCDLME